MSTPLFSSYAVIRDGGLPPVIAERLAASLRPLDGKQVKITLEAVKRKRSLNQNAYLWSVVYAHLVEMFRQHGTMVDAEDVHELCKSHIGKLRQVFVTPDGEVLMGPGSTKRLSTAEFSQYVEAVRTWAAEMGCSIPDPDKYHNHTFEE